MRAGFLSLALLLERSRPVSEKMAWRGLHRGALRDLIFDACMQQLNAAGLLNAVFVFFSLQLKNLFLTLSASKATTLFAPFLS